MKLKRVLSLGLAILTVLSLIPMSAFATTTEVESVYYDFALPANAELGITGATGRDLSADTQTDAIAALYAEGKIDWKIEERKNGGAKTDGSGDVRAPRAFNFFKSNYFKNGYGLYLMDHASTSYEGFVAIRLRAPAAGKYNVTINSALLPENSGNYRSRWTETYLFDASLLTEGKTVSDLLIARYKKLNFAPTLDALDSNIGTVKFDSADQEYILVLRLTSTARGAGKSSVTGGGAEHLALNGITLTSTGPVQIPVTGYSFDLLGNYPDDFFGGNFSVDEQADQIKKFYDAGYISWRLETTINGTMNGDGSGGEVQSFKKNELTKGGGITAYCSGGHNWLYAFRIKAPGTGGYKVNMNTWLVDSNGVKKQSVWTNVFIVEASKIDSGERTYQDVLIPRFRLGDFRPTPDKPDAEIGYYEFTAGKEYILIFQETASTYNAMKATGTHTQNFYIKGFDFVKSDPPAGYGSDNVIYNFALSGAQGIYTGSPSLVSKKEDLAYRYGREDVNWKPEEASAGSAKFFGPGITAYTNVNDYMVMRIKSPGQGLYTLSMKHGKSGRGGTGAVYILPVSELANAKDAMDIHNRVGRVAYYNDNGDVNVSNGYETLLGTWEFGADEEYLLVFEAYASSPYMVEAYTYITSITCEPGDTTANYPAARKVSPILITEGPVNTVDSCPYKATGVVNGRNYFYLPLEGKKLNVYDIDGMEFVAHVDTPFNTCRGIVVDNDGIVWAVGDNSYIFRYDPFLDVGTDEYYYKRTTKEGGSKGDAGVYSSYSGQDIILGDDGALYFAASFGGYFARYEIATGKFTNLGSVGGDSAAWSCTPVYDNGILYGTTTGDVDGDGTKTSLLLKMDALTGDILEQLDITPYVSQKEVMMRGAGICGGVILIGGDANDVKKALAVDVTGEKMKVIDINVPGFILYGPTEEKNGKVYFTAQASGVYEFDGATRTATKLDLSDAYMLGMVCNENSFATFEGDDNFPGESIVSYRSGINQPVILNPQTLKFKVLDGLVTDDHGTGNTIHSIAHGVTAEDADKLYIGVFNNTACSVLDIKTGEVVHKYETNGQTDTMQFYNGKLFVGNYNQAALVQINVDDKRRNVVLLSLKSSHHQARVHSIATGDGKVFFGSVPDWYQHGGCLSWVDLGTLEYHVERNIIKDQNIIGLAYHDGLAYVGGVVGGGTGAASIPDSSGKIAIYDVENKKKLVEIDPRDYFADLPETLTGVNGLIPDPNVEENGIIWGVCGEVLFTLHYNKQTGKVTIEEQVRYANTSESDGWTERGMQFVGNYLYVTMGSKGGVRRININDIENDNVQLPIATTNHFTVAQDGNIYYTVDDRVYMYALVTEEADWEAAELMDAKFDAIGEITAQSEAELVKLRETYNALTWTQKSMVQKLYKLNDAWIEMIEAKIESIGDVTLSDADLIFEIKAQYKALTPKDRTFVKNYMDVFVPALQAVNALLDEQAAAKVQAMIDTIPGMGEITLEKESAIREIEKAYNALTSEQRKLLNDKALLDALAKIEALRTERIEYLKQLIASIGDEVTLEDEAAINEAMDIYNWMTMDERQLVDYVTLISANNQLKKVQKEAAAAVDALILAIGDEITMDSKEAIEAARKAYDALTPGAQALVTKLATLVDAEAIFADMAKAQKTTIILVIVGAAVLLAAAGVVTVLLITKAKKKKEAAPEVVEEETVSEE